MKLTRLAEFLGQKIVLVIDGVPTQSTLKTLRSNEIEFMDRWIPLSMVNEGRVTVLVSRCNEAGTEAYDRVSETSYYSRKEAFEGGEYRRRNGDGLSIIIRPEYNEKDENGKKFFREWRSFNGEEFKESRWEI